MPLAPTALDKKGLIDTFQFRQDDAAGVWRNHVTEVDSTTQIENYAWAGGLPRPRRRLDGAKIQGFRSFDYIVENEEYDLKFVIPRILFEDDQTGQIQARIDEVAVVWEDFKNEQFADLLNDGALAASVAYDNVSFFNASRTEGDSGTIDNIETAVAADAAAIPTAAELRLAFRQALAKMLRYRDDAGSITNRQAARGAVRVIVPPELTAVAEEATGVVTVLTGGENPDRNMFTVDTEPYLTEGSTTRLMYISLVGTASRRPIIFQERMKVDVLAHTTPEAVDRNNGVLITVRQRYRFAYGDFRKMMEFTFTT